MYSLANDRIISTRMGRISYSNILYRIRGIGTWFVETCVDFLDKATRQEPFFRDDYRKEIDPLLDFFNSLMRPSWPYTNALWIVFNHDKLTGKRVLQHLYTCEKTRELYEIVKNYYENKIEKPNQAELFREKLRPIWSDLKKAVNPEFGACEECIRHIKLEHVQKHKKTLKKCDDSMWNFIFD